MSQTMKPFIFLAGFVVTSLAPASHGATIYLSTNFDEVDEIGPVNLSTATNATGLLNTGDAAGNTTIEENRTTVAVDVEPTGQHLRIDGNQNKHATMENAMTLVSDSVSALNVSFSYLLTGDPPNNELRIIYSSSGDFTDSVELRTFVITGSTRVNADPNQTNVAADVWNQASFTIASTDVTFSDTARIRFAQDSGGSISSAAYMDDIVISADPEPSTAIALAGFSYNPLDGSSEVSIRGSAATSYKLVEADDLDFSNSDQDPIPLSAATVGTLNGNAVITDSNGNATVQFNLGTAKEATFLRAESAP